MAQAPEAPAEEKPEKPGYMLVLRPTPENPTWLKEHQERMATAARRCALKTLDLKGQKRVVAMGQCIREAWHPPDPAAAGAVSPTSQGPPQQPPSQPEPDAPRATPATPPN